VDRVHIRFARQFAGANDLGGAGSTFGIGLAVVAHRRGTVHEAIKWNTVAAGDLIVVEIVRAGDLDRARAEIGVRIFVRDDRDQPPMLLRPDGDFAKLADDRPITLIRGVDRYRAIA